MSVQAIREAVIGGVKAIIDSKLASLSSKVSWENRAFEPPTGTWLAVKYLPAGTDIMTLGAKGENEITGLVQIDVNVQPNTGTKAQTDILDTLEGQLQAGVVLSNGDDQTATVVKTVRSPGRLADRDWRVSLSVYFYARHQRSV